MMTVYSITTIRVVTNHNYANNLNNEKIVSSSLLKEDESIKTDIISSDVERKEEVVNKKNSRGYTTTEQEHNIDTSNYTVISSEKVNISHFGPDCNGCGIGYVATGEYIGSGRINYNEPTFGVIRIVAADKKYPLGTIIRITYKTRNFLAIVLDRGGAIADGKKYQIDLLAESEKKSYELGVMMNATLEVLRLGY